MSKTNILIYEYVFHTAVYKNMYLYDATMAVSIMRIAIISVPTNTQNETRLKLQLKKHNLLVLGNIYVCIIHTTSISRVDFNARRETCTYCDMCSTES